MFKIALIKFESNLAVSIAWAKRQAYKKWDKVIVAKDEVLKLLRLGCSLEWERTITYADHKDLFKVSKKDIEIANEQFKSQTDKMTFELLEKFVEAPTYVTNCDEAECKAYIESVYKAKVDEKNAAEEAERKAKEKAKKEAEAKAKKEAEEKAKQEAIAKENRAKEEAKARDKAAEKEAREIAEQEAANERAKVKLEAEKTSDTKVEEKAEKTSDTKVEENQDK